MSIQSGPIHTSLMFRRPRSLRFSPSPMVIPLWYNRPDWWKLTMALTSWTRLPTEYIRWERKRSERTANDFGRLSIRLHPLESGHFETTNFVTRIRVNRALITTLESGSSELIHWFSRAQKPRSIRLKKMRLQQCPDSRRRGLNLFHLPLPLANINTYFSLRAKCWLRGGVGEQFPRNL